MTDDRYDPIKTDPTNLYEVFVQFFHDEADDLDASHIYARSILNVLRSELRIADVQGWKDNRIALSAQEEAGNADPDDWAASDDEAASLLAFILDQLQ